MDGRIAHARIARHPSDGNLPTLVRNYTRFGA